MQQRRRSLAQEQRSGWHVQKGGFLSDRSRGLLRSTMSVLVRLFLSTKRVSEHVLTWHKVDFSYELRRTVARDGRRWQESCGIL